MRNGRFLLGLLAMMLLFLLACGGAAPAPTSPPTPTLAPTLPATATSGPENGPAPADGEAIFTGSGGCAACHTIEGLTVGMVGPDLTQIGTDAGTRKPGLSAEDYIRESILEPEVFVAEGVERATPGLMTSAITASLTDSQVDALVEFLLKQR